MKDQPSRLEQMGQILTALIAVALTGASDLTATSKPQPIDPAFAARPPFGIYSRVARRLGVSPSFCRKVALAVFVSARVAHALLDELAQLRSAGRAATYATTRFNIQRSPFGTYSAIARKLGCTPQHVRRVALGLGTSARVEAELKSCARGQL